MSVYPRASAPITPFAYRMALARAERWRTRYEQAAAELAAIKAEAEARSITFAANQGDQ